MGRVRWVGPWLVFTGEFPHLTPTLSAPEGREGDFELPADRFQHARNVVHYIPVPEADYAIAVLCDLDGSSSIILSTQRVLPTIKLDDQLRRRTGEVHDVSADRVLPTKPAWQLELAQLTPKPPLSFRHISPQPARDGRFLLTITRSASELRHTRLAARRQPGSARCGQAGARGSGSSPSSPR